MLDSAEKGPQGDLEKEFKLFHLRDPGQIQLEYHYHTFDKIVVPLSGQATYLVRGKTYYLHPWDILLVSRDEIHRPVFDLSSPYERIILWLRPNFETPELQLLLNCFITARENGTRLIHPNPADRLQLMSLFNHLEEEQTNCPFGYEIMCRTYLLQVLIFLNRQFQIETNIYPERIRQDIKIEEVQQYINGHLCEDLSTESLAQVFYLSRYYLMRRFKEVTGQTIHQYVLQKRLIRASELIQDGVQAGRASQMAGFGSYITFVRAFRQTFHALPSDLK